MSTAYTNKPKVTQTDILNGYVSRYFVRNVSTKVVTEVDKKQYEAFKLNALHETLELQWNISGFANNIISTDNRIIYGTKHKNSVTIQFYEKRLPGLQRILRDPLEYFQGTVNKEAAVATNAPKYSSTLGGSVALGRTFGNEIVPPPSPTPPVVVLPTLTLSPTALNFAFTQSASLPSSEYVNIDEASGSIITGLYLESQSSWINTYLIDTFTPTTMAVEITTTNLETGSYTSSIIVTSSVSALNNTVLPVTVSVAEQPEVQPDYWWRADSGLTTSAWSASNGGLNFTLSNVTTASSAVGVVFNGTNGFGQTPVLGSSVVAQHVLIRLDSIVSNTDDAIMGGTQNNIHEIAHNASGFWNIVDARPGDAAVSPRYGVRTNTNLISPVPKILWFYFPTGFNAVSVYKDLEEFTTANMATFVGTYNNAFTWSSGYRIYLGRRLQVSGGSGYMRMNVKELAIFTSSISYDQLNAYRRQMLARWP